MCIKTKLCIKTKFDYTVISSLYYFSGAVVRPLRNRARCTASVVPESITVMPGLKQQLSGFPVWQIFVISVMRFSEPLAFTSLFPYVYFMIRDFEIAKDEASISTYAGYLSASFAFTQTLFSIQWGSISDRIGRKKVLLTGLIGSAVSLLTFGFSPNFYVALGARSFLGAVNGNIAVLRTLIGELVTERRHQAIAFLTLPLLWNVGSIIGPLIGGSSYFTRPSPRNPYHTVFEALGLGGWHEWFVTKYPYALCNIVVSMFLILGLICGFLFFEETHYKVKLQRDYGLDIGDRILTKLGFTMPKRPWHSVNDDGLQIDVDLNDEESLLSTNQLDPRPLYASVDDNEELSDGESIQLIESVGPISRRTSNALLRRYSSISMTSKTPELRSTFSRISGVSLSRQETRLLETLKLSEILTPGVVQTICGNFFLGFHNIIYSEFLPVFLSGQIISDKLQFPFHISGGFGLDSDFIGQLISVTGLMGVLVVVLIFPFLDRHFKTINSYRSALVLFPVIYSIIPFYIFTLHEYNPKFLPNIVKHILYGNGMVYQLCSAIAFPQIMLLVHRAAPAKHRAFINGTALTFTSSARFIAPLTWGYIMTYFDKHNYAGVPWFILAAISVVALVQSFWMRDYDEDLKD